MGSCYFRFDDRSALSAIGATPERIAIRGSPDSILVRSPTLDLFNVTQGVSHSDRAEVACGSLDSRTISTSGAESGGRSARGDTQTLETPV